MWFVNEYKKVMAFFNFGSRSDLSSPFTEEQARLLTWTKVLEEEALKRQKITISELKEVTAAALEKSESKLTLKSCF